MPPAPPGSLSRSLWDGGNAGSSPSSQALTQAGVRPKPRVRTPSSARLSPSAAGSCWALVAAASWGAVGSAGKRGVMAERGGTVGLRIEVLCRALCGWDPARTPAGGGSGGQQSSREGLLVPSQPVSVRPSCTLGGGSPAASAFPPEQQSEEASCRQRRVFLLLWL